MNILIAGDSLTLPRPHRIKEYNFESSLAVHFQDTYGYILQKKLQIEHAIPFVTVTNRGQRSATIKHISNDILDTVFFFQPNLIIINVGIVDCWIRPEIEQKQYVKIEEFIQHYLFIVQCIKKRPETKCIFIGICPTSNKMEQRTPGLQKEIIKYNMVLKKAIDNQQFFFIDMEQYVSNENPGQYLLPDDHHLNVQGHALIAEKLYSISKIIASGI